MEKCCERAMGDGTVEHIARATWVCPVCRTDISLAYIWLNDLEREDDSLLKEVLCDTKTKTMY